MSEGSAPETLVVDDSHFVRTVLEDLLEDRGIPVVGTARNGEEAIEAVERLRPDVITMDVEMPKMNGIEAVERIMEQRPTPILMLSAHTEEGADVTFDALEKGAVDVYTKPGGEVSVELSGHKEQLAEMVRSVAKADVGQTRTRTERRSRDRRRRTDREESDGRSTSAGTTGQYVDNPTLLIGSSTGGPKVVERVLAALPAEADLRILIVQHMPSGFTRRFADRLDGATEYDVAEAEDGMRIGGGQALVAAGEHHMAVSGYASGRLRVKLNQDPPEHGSRPAVDVTMRTAAEAIDDPMVGAIFTGMGSDGAQGIAALKRAGAHTIAQNEATCAVYSMPRNAIETGCIDRELPIDEIPEAILNAITESN